MKYYNMNDEVQSDVQSKGWLGDFMEGAFNINGANRGQGKIDDPSQGAPSQDATPASPTTGGVPNNLPTGETVDNPDDVFVGDDGKQTLLERIGIKEEFKDAISPVKDQISGGEHETDIQLAATSGAVIEQQSGLERK